MMRGIRFAGVWIALVAMMLRAFLPDGWMPNTAGTPGVLITLCTMYGPVQTIVGPYGQPVKQSPAHNDGRHHEVCSFAAAPHFATVTPTVLLSVAVNEIRFDTPIAETRVMRSAHDHWPQSPRGPPSRMSLDCFKPGASFGVQVPSCLIERGSNVEREHAHSRAICFIALAMEH